MPSSANTSSPVSRKFAWLAGAAVASGLLWTAGWYAFAAKVKTELPATLAQLVGPAASAQCISADVRGYPFRFGVFCETLSYENTAEGISANAGAFRSAAQVYRPQHAVAEVDGPLMFNTSGLSLRADWQVLKASARAATNGLERGSVEARNISFDMDGAGLAGRFGLQAAKITAHARRNGADLDLAAYADDLRNDLVAGLTARTFVLEATLTERSRLLEMPFVPLQGPFEAVLHRLAIAFDETSSLELTGPVRIDAGNRISGDLELTISDLQQFTDRAEAFDPDIADLFRQFGPVVAALDTRPGDDAVSLPLTIKNNLVSLGFIPLGQLPAF